MVATTQCVRPQQVLGQGHWHYCTSEQLPQSLQQPYLSVWRSSPGGHTLPSQLQTSADGTLSKRSKAFGLAKTLLLMSTSLHYRLSTTTIHRSLDLSTSAEASLDYRDQTCGILRS